MTYQLRIKYASIYASRTILHQMNMWVKIAGTPSVGADFSDIQVTTKIGGAQNLDAFVTAYVMSKITPFFNTGTSFNTAELRLFPDASQNSEFIANFTIGDTGDSASPTRPAAQNNFMFRSSDNSSVRLCLLESVVDLDDYDSYPLVSGAGQNLANAWIDDDSAIISRSGAFLTSVIAQSNGQNEAIWRKRFRDF